MAIIQSGASATQWTIDAVSDAGRVTFYDTNGNPMSNVSSLNNILNSLNDNVTITLGGQSTGGFNVASTSGTLTLSFEATINDVDWFAVNATPVPSGSPITSTTTNGQWVVDLAGFYAVRARISSFSSGSMTVSAVVTPQNSKSIAQVVAIAGTVPVSGSVNQGIPNTTANSWPVEMTDGTNVLGTNAHPVRTDPTGTTTQPVSILGTVPVSGTVTSNIGTTNGLALDTSVNGVLVSQGSSTSGEKGPLVQGAVTTSAPSYTTAQTSPLSLTTAGALRTDSSTTTQPVSGTVTANAGAGTFTVGGAVASNQGTAAALSNKWPVQITDGTNIMPVGDAVSRASFHKVTDGINTATVTASSALKIDGSAVTQPVSGTVTAVQTTAANLNATSAQGAPNTIGNSWPVEVTDGTNILGTAAHPLRNDPTGTTTQPVSISGTVPVSGTVVSNQGTSNTLANAWPHQLTDGSNGPVAVKAASTPPVATDPSLVVTISPNSPPAVTNTGVISTVNSSTATLGSGATFTGTGESTLSYESVTISVMAIGAAAPPGTLIVEQSSDGINWDIQYPFSVTGGTTSPIGEFDITIQLVASNFRIIYTNGAIVQTSFRLQTIKWPIKTATPNATQKAIQPLLFTATQDAKDSGRVVKSFVATGAATVTSEAMVTLTPSSDFVVGATSTSFTVISGKRLRLQSVSVVYKTTAATALGGLFRLRISSSGAVTIATPMAVTLGTPNTIAAIGAISNDFVNFPDGLELSGTMQFGISQLSTVTTSVVDITITGYEY